MKTGNLGKPYKNGEIIVRQGEEGNCMFVIQMGQVEVLYEKDGRQVKLAVMNEGEIFGEMALFEREVRSATVRALGEVRVLTVDKKSFLRRLNADPSLAFHLIQKLTQRVRRLNDELARLQESTWTHLAYLNAHVARPIPPPSRVERYPE